MHGQPGAHNQQQTEAGCQDKPGPPSNRGVTPIREKGEFQQDQGGRQEDNVLLGSYTSEKARQCQDPEKQTVAKTTRTSGQQVARDSQEVKKACEGGHPLNNVNHGLGLDGVERPQQGRHQRDGTLLSLLLSSHVGCVEQATDNEKQKKRCQAMDKDVDQPITNR